MSVFSPLTSRAFVAGVCVALALLAVNGCHSNELKTYPVRGIVVNKQTQKAATQVAGGYVVLEPLFEPKTVQVRGLIDEDGTFSLGSVIDSNNRSGAPAGEYRVRIELPDDGAARQVARGLIDRRFEQFGTSDLKLTVTAGKNDVTLEVEGPRRYPVVRLPRWKLTLPPRVPP